MIGHVRTHQVLLMASAVAAAVTVLDAQTFRTRVDLVRVDVLVTDRGLPVRGLTAADFEVRDNDVLQQVDAVFGEDIPVNAILTLDLSQSVVGDRLTQLRRAGLALIDALKPNDQTALIGFSHAVVLGSGLTRDFDRVREAIRQTLTSGETSIADACFTSLLLGDSDPGRALVLAFSDGMDTSSWLTPAAVLDSARRSDAVVYAVSVADTDRTRKLTFLDDLTGATGGAVFQAASTSDLSREFLKVLTEFRLRYLISYTPRGVTKDGMHRLEIKVKGRGYKIKARPGYLAR
jgi:VWFA-related protein